MDRPSLQETLSQETLISLQQLEPSPVESPLDLEKQLSDVPTPRTNPRPFSLGLSGSGHGAVYYLTRLQRYSSYIFTVYTTFHITNTSLIPLITRSVPASERYLLLTRPYYQSPLMEPLLVAFPLLTHVASGLILRIYRRNTSLIRYGGSEIPASSRLASQTHVWPPISYASISGYVLAPLVLGHAFVNRILPWWYEGGSSGVGLGFVSHGFAKHQTVDWVGYAALVGIASGHIVWGWAKWMSWAPTGVRKTGSDRKRDKRRWWVINGVSAFVAAVWMAGGLGVVARGGRATGWVGRGWDDLYAKVPLFG